MAGSTAFMRRKRRDVGSCGWGWKRCFAAAGALSVVLAGAGGPTLVAADGETAAAQVVSVARTFQAAVTTHDSGTLLGLLDGNAVVKERNAVLATGRERLASWIGGCLVNDFVLEPDTLVFTTDSVTSTTSATWAFADSTGCYWRLRPGAETAPWPGQEVNPAEGLLTITVAQERITSLTLVYSDAWQARYLRSVAAPIVAAQARATTAVSQHVAATAVAATEESRAASSSAPHAPDTQGRTTPSVGPWLAALGLLGLVGIMAAGSSRTH